MAGVRVNKPTDDEDGTARLNVPETNAPPLPVSPSSEPAQSPGQRGAWWGTTSTATQIQDPTTDWTQEHSEAMAPQYNARQKEFEDTTDWRWIEDNLKRTAAESGGRYDISDLEGIRRNAGYDATHLGDAGLYNSALQKYYENAVENIRRGASNVPGGNEGSNDNPRAALSNGAYPYPGGTFSDPWTSQLEQLINKQLNGLTNAQPGSPQAMMSQYLLDRFKELSSAQGYTPSEQAILNTQAFEPIEKMRSASQQRELERAAARGILPSSGLVQDAQRQNDLGYDQLRTVANRDLAVNQINRQDQQRQQALSMIQGLNTQEGNVNDKALQLATLLRQLPMDALSQALGVVNGTGNPSNLLSQVSQMVASQQQNSQNNTNAWLQALGYGLDTLFG